MTSQRHKNQLLKVLAVEDGSFSKADRYCLLVGVVVTCNTVERVMLDWIDVDGMDSIKKVVSLARRSKGVDVVMLPSVSLGGFNVTDPYKLHKQLKLPILIANPEKPRLRAVREALRQHFPDWRQRVMVFDLMGLPAMLQLSSKEVLYFYSVGLPAKRARTMLRSLTVFGKKPEPLRIARIVARALSPTSPLKATRRV